MKKRRHLTGKRLEILKYAGDPLHFESDTPLRYPKNDRSQTLANNPQRDSSYCIIRSFEQEGVSKRLGNSRNMLVTSISWADGFREAIASSLHAREELKPHNHVTEKLHHLAFHLAPCDKVQRRSLYQTTLDPVRVHRTSEASTVSTQDVGLIASSLAGLFFGNPSTDASKTRHLLVIDCVSSSGLCVHDARTASSCG